MTDTLTKAVDKLSDRFLKFQVEEFPNSQRELGERIKGVEVEMKGVHGRLKKLEHVEGKGIQIVSNQPAREDDSTVVEVPHPRQSVESTKVGLNIPWQIILKLLGIVALVLLAAGFYMGNSGDKEAMIKALNEVTTTTQALKTQVKVLSIPVGEPERYRDVSESEMLKATP